ncbi:hypothetical protein FISHEDRAFT_57171 [Fistulina hepatica ATCC 64428]|nr:hypothetical protein FISHEDRAFT_57171 [Fistulina hepatica ATCC 64428]
MRGIARRNSHNLQNHHAQGDDGDDELTAANLGLSPESGMKRGDKEGREGMMRNGETERSRGIKRFQEDWRRTNAAYATRCENAKHDKRKTRPKKNRTFCGICGYRVRSKTCQQKDRCGYGMLKTLEQQSTLRSGMRVTKRKYPSACKKPGCMCLVWRPYPISGLQPFFVRVESHYIVSSEKMGGKGESNWCQGCIQTVIQESCNG